MKKNTIYIFAAIVMISCKTYEDQDYFFDKINYINTDYEKINLAGETIVIEEGIMSLYFSVYDSLMFFWNSRMPDFTTYSISNIKNGQHLGNYIFRGRGPHESLIAPICHFYCDDNEIKTLLFAPNEEELREWNISESLKKGLTVYDEIIPYLWREEQATAYLNTYKINFDNLLVKISARRSELTGKIQAWPRYQTRSIKENKKIRDHDIFKQELYIGDPEKSSISPFYSNDCIKPDGTKIAQGMAYLSQINIIDTESGKVSYYRSFDSPSLTVFKKEATYANVVRFYHGTQCDNNYIYGLFWGSKERDNNGKIVLPDKIHQFDWDGKLIREIKLSEPATQIWLDDINNLLYTYNEINEEIFRYDLNKL